MRSSYSAATTARTTSSSATTARRSTELTGYGSTAPLPTARTASLGLADRTDSEGGSIGELRALNQRLHARDAEVLERLERGRHRLHGREPLVGSEMDVAIGGDGAFVDEGALVATLVGLAVGHWVTRRLGWNARRQDQLHDTTSPATAITTSTSSTTTTTTATTSTSIAA